MNLSREKFEELKKLPFFKGKVVTGSMVPVIQVGEGIVVEVGQKNLKRFDIIVIFVDGKLICHYLWQMNKLVQPILLQTRNMAGGLDFPVGLEDYFGKVVSHRISLWQKLKIIF
jgi:signal peptidase I